LSFAAKGQNVTLNPPLNVTFADRCKFGNDIYMGSGAFLSTQGGLRIDDGVIIGPRFTVYTADHNYEDAEAIPYDGKVLLKLVHIKENVWIGGDVIVVPGTAIGEGAVVAAGAVVTKNVPNFAVVGGNPAKVIKYRDKQKYLALKEQRKIYIRMKQQQQIISSEIRITTQTEGSKPNAGV